MLDSTGFVDDSSTRLMRALAEELKLPLMQISRSAELGQLDGGDNLQTIETTASNALRLLDGYILTTQLMGEQQQLEIEPVSVTAVLYDTAQDLYKLSRLYDTKLDIRVNGKCGQVMSNARALRAALASIAYTFVSSGISSKQQIMLTASKSNRGVITGVSSDNCQFSAQELQLARKLYGNARQPAKTMTSNSGAGVYLADRLFEAMESRLKFGHYRGNVGLFAWLMASQQLTLL